MLAAYTPTKYPYSSINVVKCLPGSVVPFSLGGTGRDQVRCSHEDFAQTRRREASVSRDCGTERRQPHFYFSLC